MNRDEGFHFFLIRKSIHFSFGAVSIALLFWMPALATELLLIAACIFLLGDLFRRRVGKWQTIFRRIFGNLLKPAESTGQITAATTFVITVAGLMVTYPPVIVVASILILSVSDSLASVAGKLFPMKKIRNEKSLTGSMTFFFSCLMICWFLIPAAFLMLAAASLLITAIELFTPDVWENILIGFGSAVILLFIF